MIPSSELHLLKQDNTIPGNRKDGFRYHHLKFVIVATPLYLWLELSFGVRLLDNIGGQIISQDTIAIEHWGRLISGLAVSLLFLSGWINLCERMNRPWHERIIVGILISIACIVLTWWGQARVIDFYISRSAAEISTALRVLAVTIIIGFLIIRYWIHYALITKKLPYARMVIGLLVIFAIGHVVMHFMLNALPSTKQNLGLERQQAATLTLVRRGLEEAIYTLPGIPRPREDELLGAENKAFLALFPIFGSVFDQAVFAKDRPFLIKELMYRDWDKEFGERAFNAFTDTVVQLRDFYDTEYRTGARDLPDGTTLPAKLDWNSFAAHPGTLRYLRMSLGCFDCQFKVGMDRKAFGRELHLWNQASNVKQAIQTFESPEHFQEGRDGERAARAYWVPIWALLFSIVGAFTHLFKMIFTITEYAHRMTFHRVRAADSPLADQVIANSRYVTAAVVFGMALIIYFSENRITGHPKYVEFRPTMFQTHPIAGALAAHWTVNAQGFLYPFTSKLRPHWLTFNSDPLAHVPLVSRWVSDEY
ncbi:MAG: hypothetical protein IPH08_08590 [Rhodocyclaceae bacterium]|nr:hypothetical protein [Rhodocyclaceae bacterium]